MNFCTVCRSYYQTPGTCNCYVQLIHRTTPSTGGCPNVGPGGGICFCTGACRGQPSGVNLQGWAGTLVPNSV